jgi:hypothetical protein
MTTGRRRGRWAERWIAAAGKYLGLVGTALKLAQLAPAAVGVAVVVFSPSAWLSDTLRQWAIGGIVAGGVAGMVVVAAYGGRIARRERLAAGLLVAALVAGAALRLHLAVADLAFVGRWPFLLPLHDAFLGTDLGERLFNLGAAAGFGLTVFLATLGLPPYLRARGRSRARSTAATPDAAPLHEALATLSAGIATWQRADEELREENRRLRERLAALQALQEAVQETPPTAMSDGDVPTRGGARRAEPPP